jgi:hypothetical protein
MKNIGNHFFAAIPFRLIDAAGDGNIKPSMLAVMIMLYRWANWKTGRVKRTSAGAIAQFCQGKWSERTIQDALKKLEELGYITRHFKKGSHKWYPVTIHNYIASVKHPVMGPDGKPERDADGRLVTTVKMEPINVKKIKGWDEDEDESLQEDCADCSDGSSDEGLEDGSHDSSDEASADCSDNTNHKRSRHNRKLSGKKQTDPITKTKTSRSKSKFKLSSVNSSKQEIQEWAEEIARKLEPDSKYRGDSVKKLMDFLSTADESARTCISDAVSEPLVMARLSEATDSKMGYLIDAVRKGYVSQWLEKAEKEKAKQRKRALKDALFLEEEGPDGEDSAAGKPKSKGCVLFDEACHCPKCELFRSRRAFVMEIEDLPESVAGWWAGRRWKEYGQSDKGHEAVEARYEAWKVKKASAA